MKSIKNKDQILIFDTTLRDGEQAPGASLNTGEKIKIAVQLEELGVDIIEAGFPVSSPGDFEAVEKVSKSLKKTVVAGLARAIKNDIEVCAKALKAAKRPRIHTFISSSDIHLKYQFKKTRAEALEAAIQAVKLARQLSDDVEFSAMDASRTELDFLCQMLEKAIHYGARTINIPDTVGYTTPDEFASLIQQIKNRIPNIEKAVISVHCHNDLGLAVANSIAAIQNGARQVECTINGIGERAGNASLEEIVMILNTRSDQYPYVTNIDTQQIYKSSRLVSSLTGFMIQPNKAIVGSNAFAHESGIHQDGILKYRQTYEIIKPQMIGIPSSRLILGKHSGRHAFSKRIQELGYQLSFKEVEKLFLKFKDLADKKKDVYDEDVESLVDENMFLSNEMFQLIYFHTTSGNKTLPTATLKLKKGNQEIQEAACGDGPVDAIFNAIDRATGFNGKLENYGLKSLTRGRDAQGEVTVSLSNNGDEVHGHGISTDIIEASAKAYLNGVNKFLLKHKKKNSKNAFRVMKGL
jgi:2-isopropylmalate synthase